MSGRSQLPFVSRVTPVWDRLRWLAVLPVVLLWACSGGSSGPGDPPDPSSTEPPPDPPPPVATSLSISPDSAQLEGSGETAQFVAEVLDQDGNVMADVSVTWSSNAPEVATVNATGLVTAIDAGTATVTAATGELSVTVETPPDDTSTGTARDREALVALYESTGGRTGSTAPIG